MWLRKVVSAQDPHSWYLSTALALSGLTLVIDLVFHHQMSNKWLIWLLLGICVMGMVLVLLIGASVPRAVGVAGVCVFVLAQSYFMSLPDDPQSVISSVQQFPIVALYLGWFVRPRLAFPLVIATTLLFGWVLATNPLVEPDEVIGLPVMVHGLLILLFCFTAGSYLWHRNSRAATTDALTGVRTRGGFMTDLEALTRGWGGRELSIILVDFDGLKRINDTRGHAAGDQVLVETTLEWREALLGGKIGRLGGDEFAIALPDTPLSEAQRLCVELREQSAHAWTGGVAELREEETLEQWIQRADMDLYESKARVGGLGGR